MSLSPHQKLGIARLIQKISALLLKLVVVGIVTWQFSGESTHMLKSQGVPEYYQAIHRLALSLFAAGFLLVIIGLDFKSMYRDIQAIRGRVRYSIME